MHISRRHILSATGALFVSGLACPALGKVPNPAPRRLGFENLHTGERLTTEYWADGRYLPDALSSIDRLLRDFRTGEAHPIAPKLLDLLNTLQHELESSAPFHVISGYRSPQTNAALHDASNGVATKSLHMEGKAIDIRLPDRELESVHRVALALGGGGVGYYPKSDFVHVDIGRVRRW